MGLIKAFAGAVGGSLGDQWLEAIEPAEMGEGVVCCEGVRVRKGDRRDSNTRGTEDAISNGSLIHVYDMLPNLVFLKWIIPHCPRFLTAP